MINNKWAQRFLDLAGMVAEWSKDPSTKVGAVIVDDDRRIISVGYNGPPKGVDDSFAFASREEKLRCTIHAEENAILFAGHSVKGCHLIVTHMPCSTCAAKIIQSGIHQVTTQQNEEFDRRWHKATRTSFRLFREAKVLVRIIR